MENLSHFEPEDETTSPFGISVDEDWNYLNGIIEQCEPTADFELIKKAFYFCADAHSDAIRKSGLPYYTHPLNVVLVLLQEFSIHDSNTIAGALLHDTIEDVEGVTKELIAKEFNSDVADIVESVTKIKHENITKDLQFDEQKNKAFTYRKLFLALVKDVRVIIIKLADRLHNMRTLQYMKPEKQELVAIETLNFYVPFAHRLGLTRIKMELENRSFYFSNSKLYNDVKSALETKRWNFIEYINLFSNLITETLAEHNIDHVITIIHKHEYEIYKMIQDGQTLEDIDNFYSLVIVLSSDNPSICYQTFGVLANAFKTVHFLDGIANPTIDWFKSLRLDVMGPDGKKVEILIRTREMEKISEEGFASAYLMKGGGFRALVISDSDLDQWGSWMEEIIESEGEKAAKIIWDSIKVNIFDSALTVYTKTGEQVFLPEGSSVLDFAFQQLGENAIHSIAGKVNGRICDLNWVLSNTDQVEIILSQNYLPEVDWLNYVIFYKSVVILYNYFKSQYVAKSEDDPILSPVLMEDIKLIIRGEDRKNMLSDITTAIGTNNIKKINLGALGEDFEGILTLEIPNKNELNRLFFKLLSIPGIREAVTIID
ncbi:MAG: HD domain-containing protein [bacterium]